MVGIHALSALILLQDPTPREWADKLRSPDAAERRVARGRLVGAGAAAFEPLIDVLLERYPDLERRADELVTALNSEDPAAREQATDDLIRIGARIEKILKGKADGMQGEMRLRISRVLAWISKNAEDEKQRSALQKASACWVLGRMKDARASEAVLTTAGHPDPAVRLEAIEALGWIRSEPAVDKLSEWLAGDADWRIRSACALSLGRIGSESARSALRARLAGGLEEHERVVFRMLSGLAEDPSAEAARLMIQKLESPSATLRHAAHQLIWRRAGLTDVSFAAHRDASENRAGVERYQRWWETQYGAKWE